MMKYVVWMFGLTVCSLLWICSASDVQEIPAAQGGTHLQPVQSQTGQTHNACQKRPIQSCTGNKRQRIPKPERNTFEATKRKKGRGSRQRKSRGKNCSKGTRTTLAVPGETPVSPSSRKKKESFQNLHVTSERVDDIPLLLEAMHKMGMQQIIDRQIPVQRHQRELSWGWTTVIWLAYILSEGDHRKVAVQEYIRGMQQTLSELTGLNIDEQDFADDRLTVLLSYLAKKEFWEMIEHALSTNSIEAYELPTDLVRVDATTVSGYHDSVENGIFQYGHSKDDPHRPQIKVMTGSLDPLGMPLATDVVSGENADDGLYAPVISRLSSLLQKEDVLYVGDSKLSSSENRLHIKGPKIHGHYLCPLPNKGKTPEKMTEWIQEGNRKDAHDQLIKYLVTDAKGEEELKAKGYELEREQSGEVDGDVIRWNERVLIVNSPAHAKQKEKGLEKRLRHAAEKLYKLTPPRGRGKRQITEEAHLLKQCDAILKQHKVEGLLSYEYKKEVERREKYIGRGRGSKNRKKAVQEKVRYQVTTVMRDETKLQEERKTYGWRVYVTDVPRERLGFIAVVESYRKQYSIERIFMRLKSRLNIAPFYVKRDDQTKGMTHLLTLGVRVYTLIEFVVRRSLARSDEELVGLHLENPKKATDSPTCERLLQAFSKITLTIIDLGDRTLRHITPLSQLQTDILRHLGLDPGIYKNLEIRQSSKIKTE